MKSRGRSVFVDMVLLSSVEGGTPQLHLVARVPVSLRTSLFLSLDLPVVTLPPY